MDMCFTNARIVRLLCSFCDCWWVSQNLSMWWGCPLVSKNVFTRLAWFPNAGRGRGWQISTCAEKQQQTSWYHTVFRCRQTPVLCSTVENLETRKMWQKWPVISTWRNEEWWLIFGVFSSSPFLHRWSHTHSFAFWIGWNYLFQFNNFLHN